MSRIAILTPNRDAQSSMAVWSDILSAYRELFRRHGVDIVPVPWNEACDARDIDAVLPLLAWGYHRNELEWRRVIEQVARATPVVNDARVLLWNTRKTYLESMRRAGVCVVPTLFAERADASTATTAFDRFGSDELVIKPAVSGGGDRTVRLARGAPPPDLEDAMVQPFLPSIVDEGEISLIFFDGEFSHATRKVPARGDFRVQYLYGGTVTRAEVDTETIATARRAIEAAPAPLAYARVDLVRLPGGAFAVIELEAIEPEMFLQFDPSGGARLVRSVQKAIADLGIRGAPLFRRAD
jgi:glutathione synthase/RimK-type ligase-like ATP-grasp enzyme